MATSCQSCGVCDLRHITKPSIVWCTECDEGLCTECQEHHGLSKASRRHKVIPIIDYQKLPTDVLKITQYCSKHDEKFQIYCKKHECPCCSKCIVESHSECRDIVNLDDVIHNVKTSNALCEIEETLVEVAENLQKVRQHIQDNRSNLKDKRMEIEKEIKKTRIMINHHLDKLQEDFLKQLFEVEEKDNSKICQLVSSLEIKEKEIAEYQRNVSNIKQHASDLQLFLSMKQIEKDVNSKDKFLHSLVANEGQLSLTFKINASIKNIMSDTKSFGEVHIEAKPYDIVLIEKKAQQAQTMIQTRSIENLKLTLHETINTQGEYMFGCCMLLDGRMAFTLLLKQTVNVFSDKGLQDFEVKLPIFPCDIVYIGEDNTLAVTSESSKCITIIDVERKQIKKTISLDSDSYGIALKDNRLIYYVGNKGIRMINLNDESISDIVRDKMLAGGSIATFKDKLYHTNTGKNTVTCYNLQGQLQWKFQNEGVLQKPHGIDVDNDGNVYVVGSDSHNVVVISPDGTRHREIMTASDGLKSPMLVHYSGFKNQLLVANWRNNAHLFSFI
ncbi:tripartite motif-containing protein 2-like [Mytilus edulis]|uniref:tripartite motif-containing protein 2-like n=1 Tax=Mytilus edulis TaxID=6550 RepID=UPI0039F023A9